MTDTRSRRPTRTDGGGVGGVAAGRPLGCRTWTLIRRGGLTAAFLLGYRGHTRRAYFGDIRGARPG